MYKRFKEIISASTLFLILFPNSKIEAQVDTLWTKTYGGNGDEYAASIDLTSDDGFILTGYTDSFGAGIFDVWLIKTTASGDTVWTKTFGGNKIDIGYSVQETSDKGYIITGQTYSLGSNGDVWLIKTDSSGDTIWTKTFGGKSSDYGTFVQTTYDGGYIITGKTYSFNEDADIWFIKTDSMGDTLWTRTYNGGKEDCGYSVQQTTDDGYVIIGQTNVYDSNNYDIWLIKTNSTGDTLWTKTFGGVGGEGGYSVQQTSDGGYIVTGYSETFGNNSDVWLIKTDSSGVTLWTKTFGGEGNDGGFSVLQTINGGFIVTGHTSSFGSGNNDVWLIKTDSTGDTLWTKTFGGMNPDIGYSVQQTSDMSYIIAGCTFSTGVCRYNFLLIKTTIDANLNMRYKNDVSNDYGLHQNFPNPFNPKTTFKYYITKSELTTISIYTISGQIIKSITMNLNPGIYSYEFDGSDYSSGIYFYRISTSSGFTAGRKMVLLK